MSSRPRRLLAPISMTFLLALVAVGVLLVLNRRPDGQAIVLPALPTPSALRVHVTGAVQSPGVYELAAGSIVQDAIEAAGGLAPDAEPGALNLARLVHDGDQVLVPSRTPASTPGTAGAVPATVVAAPNGPLNLNTATAAELETLPGIGPALAQRIVDYRTEHGPFSAIEGLMEVPGIGEGKFEAIKDLVTV